VIKELKDFLYQEGALYAAMSGSGSTVFGIFDTPKQIISDSKHHVFNGAFI